jgi:phosphatidylglycerophosphate synthase
MSSRPSDHGNGRPLTEGGRPPAARSGVNPTRIDNPGAAPASGPAPSAAAGSSGPSGTPLRGTPTAAEYYAANRGGGLFSEGVSQRIGARIAVAAHKRHLSPTVLSILNLGLGCLVSFIVIATAGPVADRTLWAAPIGLLALVGWQLAYAFDCADGQLARVTGQSSPAGGRLDVLCDVAVQCSLVAALAATAIAQEPATPAWLLAAFAATWMVNLVTSVMQSGTQAASMVTSTSFPVRVAKLVRDYGAVIALAGVVLTIAPQWAVWFVALFTLINGGFLAASIAFAGRAALKGS